MSACIHTLNVCPHPPCFSPHLSLSASFLSFSLFLSVYPSLSLSVSLSLSPTDSSDSDLELSTVRHQPEGLDQLQAQTKFTRKELQSLYRGFKNVCLSSCCCCISRRTESLNRFAAISMLYIDSSYFSIQPSFFSSLGQECPSGLVDEETFKTIYSQFFPQGG